MTHDRSQPSIPPEPGIARLLDDLFHPDRTGRIEEARLRDAFTAAHGVLVIVLVAAPEMAPESAVESVIAHRRPPRLRTVAA
jgi:hypothetical protein